MESNYIRVLEVALLVLLFITFLSALLFLFYEILVCPKSRDIARNRTTSDPERGTEGLDAGEIMERAVGSESQALLRIHEALGALRPRNQQQQQPQPGNDKRKGVIRSLPEPESYGSRYQRIMNDTAEECVICLEEFVSGDVCRILPTCKHIFHLGCIDKWLLNHQLACPICRSSAINE